MKREDEESFLDTFLEGFLVFSFGFGLFAKFGGDFDNCVLGERWRDNRDIDSIESLFLGCE